MNSPRLYEEMKFIFRFVPVVSFGIHHFHFDRDKNAPNDLYGLGFYRYKFLLGIGPEIGIDTRAGYFYLQFIPLYSLNYVHYDKVSLTFDNYNYAFNLETELGYQFFISHNINARLLVRGSGSPAS